MFRDNSIGHNPKFYLFISKDDSNISIKIRTLVILSIGQTNNINPHHHLLTFRFY